MYGFALRMYDQHLGRWHAADPYEQHWSPYLAMSNNPVSFVDPDGGWDEWYDRSGVS
jgi:RHS repeat-associated protein